LREQQKVNLPLTAIVETNFELWCFIGNAKTRNLERMRFNLVRARQPMHTEASGTRIGKRMQPSKNKKLLFADVFAGCGGLSLGLMQAGLQGRFAIEHDKFAFETLCANFLARDSKFKFSWPRWLPKEPISIGRLLRAHRNELEELEASIDVVVGGPPCQGFSSAGRRKHDDPRNQLFTYYLQIVKILKPKAVLIENVRGFTMDFESGSCVHNYAQKLRQRLSEDYDVFEELLDVTLFGVPQGRTRYFLIALEPGLCEGNPFDHLRKRLPSFLRAMGLQVPVSSSAAISDLEIANNGRRPSVDTAGFDEIDYGRPLTQYQRLMADGTVRPSDLRLAKHLPEIERRFAKIIRCSHAEGRLNTSISEELRARFGLKKRALRVLDPDRPSPTVTSMPDDLLHYAEPRTLTVRENARLQSFPDWFAFKGKYTTGGHLRRHEVPRFTQVANAVPPLVARALGELLVEILLHASYRPACKSRAQAVTKASEFSSQI
jgi:DNA (cytosine-5)-methyltransferase 1